jgi:hypothetical protein
MVELAQLHDIMERRRRNGIISDLYLKVLGYILYLEAGFSIFSLGPVIKVSPF